MKTSNVFVLLRRAIIIHPKLKMEDNAIISRMVLVVICRALPINVDSSMDTKIRGFIMNISK